ncbi:MAG: DegT/DnrJ/EryC1/StrS family aminotransferase [Candidatus Gottesmanbacteria bacterium]
MIPVNKPSIYPEMYNLTKEALDSGWLSGEGPMVRTFEIEFSRYIKTRYGSATNSGTAALHLAVVALGIGKGDEVLIPALTIASCYFAVWYAGATVIPVDIDPETYTINPVLIEKSITKKTRAVMPVHLYGHPCDMDPIMQIAKKHNLYVIEDAAEAHGAEYKGRKVGAFGDISIFSFYANKIVTCGEGGMLLTNNKSIYERAVRLKSLSHSKKRRFVHDAIGYNYQMTNVQAAIGLASFSHINESIQKKRMMAQFYTDRLKRVPGLILPTEKPWAKNVYWMYAARIKQKTFGMNRDALIDKLLINNIQTRTFFFSPRTAFKKFRVFQNRHYPVAEMVEKEGLYLPSGLGNTKSEMLTVVSVIKQLATFTYET